MCIRECVCVWVSARDGMGLAKHDRTAGLSSCVKESNAAGKHTPTHISTHCGAIVRVSCNRLIISLIFQSGTLSVRISKRTTWSPFASFHKTVLKRSYRKRGRDFENRLQLGTGIKLSCASRLTNSKTAMTNACVYSMSMETYNKREWSQGGRNEECLQDANFIQRQCS